MFKIAHIWWSQLLSLLTLATGSFLVTWLFTDLLRFTQTVYIGILAVVTGAFLAGYLRWDEKDWGGFWSHQWIWGIVGAVVAGPILVMLLAQGKRAQARGLPSIPRPAGLALVGAIVWEGIVYGMAEGILLSVLPVLMTWQMAVALNWTQSGIGAVFAGILALVASVLVIVIHHLGYREFRGSHVAAPALSCGILSLAYLLSMNPFAAIGGHIIMHIGAVFQGVALPPHENTGVPGPTGAALAHTRLR